MGTEKYGLPLILGTASAKVPRDFNSLANGIDFALFKEVQRLDNSIVSLANGSPRGVYSTLAELSAAKPSGDSSIYLVQADGKWYFWNGSGWIAGGVYQVPTVVAESVGISEQKKTARFQNNKIDSNESQDLLNHFSNVADLTFANGSGQIVTVGSATPRSDAPCLEVSLTNASASHFSVQNIPLSTKPPAIGFWLKKSEMLAQEAALELFPTIWFQNASGTTLLNLSLDTLGIKANSLTNIGMKFQKTVSGITLIFESLYDYGDYIYWVGYTDAVYNGSVKCRSFVSFARKTIATTLNFFDPRFVASQYKVMPKTKKTGAPLKYDGKRLVSLGDSITWQDGKAYAGNGLIARGYQTHMKERLGFIEVLNMGVSGRPMANGSANGVGTNTTGKTVTYASYDVVTIASGTNDFKLNIPLGNMGAIGDTTFDTNTFYGAYRDLVEYILTQKPTQKIFLFTPLQRDNGGYSVNTTNTAGHKLSDYVNAVKDVGKMYGIPVVDLFADSGLTKLNLATYTWDGLHPNDLGYERVSELIIGQLSTK